MRQLLASSFVAVVAMTGFAAAGCGTTGLILFEEVDPGFSSQRQIRMAPAVDTIDCEDYQSGEQIPMLYPYYRKKILYVTTCTKDGGGIPWKVLGVFHATKFAFDKWPKYSGEVAEKAREEGCPALLVRRAPPPIVGEARGIGALCVDPAVPSGVRGPMRIGSLSEEPIRVFADGEPLPPPRP